jgi:molybdate transport system substrate-binding protein
MLLRMRTYRVADAPLRWLVAVLLLVPALAGCGGGSDAASSSGHETLHVLAASSLTEVFDVFANEFEAEHPGVTVTPVYDASATLVTQLREGRPADLIATADLDTMQTVVNAGEVHPPAVFASNRLVMVTPRNNPANINGFDDLSRDGITWAACVGSTPCGKVARALIKKNKIWNWPTSLEVDVKAVLAKVTSGSADAGLVYATDAVAAGSKVRTFQIPDSGSEVNQYAIAVAQQSGAPGLAQEFMDLVRSSHGQQVLSDAGFGPAH